MKMDVLLKPHGVPFATSLDISCWFLKMTATRSALPVGGTPAIAVRCEISRLAWMYRYSLKVDGFLRLSYRMNLLFLYSA